jgi:hypothetical protein
VTPTVALRPPTLPKSSSSQRRLPQLVPLGELPSSVPPSRHTVWALSSTPPVLSPTRAPHISELSSSLLHPLHP